jgi:cytidylate kinase
MKITIDGPAGSGKSTVAKELSKRLKVPYLNTGLVYRAFAYISLTEGIDNVEQLLQLEGLRVMLDVGKTQVFYKDKELDEGVLNSEKVGERASYIASHPNFREGINQFFRGLVGSSQVVAEGRDAGSHIFPEADLKVFLTASPEERARRRWEQLRSQGMQMDYKEILRAVIERDERDKNRPIYPFRPAEGAIIINTSNMPIEEAVQRILSLVRERV